MKKNECKKCGFKTSYDFLNINGTKCVQQSVEKTNDSHITILGNKKISQMKHEK